MRMKLRKAGKLALLVAASAALVASLVNDKKKQADEEMVNDIREEE